MRVNVRLAGPAAQAGFAGAVIVISGCLFYAVFCDFLIGALSDWRIAITPDASFASFITAAFTGDGANPSVLAAALDHLPNSPRLHYKMAEFERSRTDSTD